VGVSMARKYVRRGGRAARSSPSSSSSSPEVALAYAGAGGALTGFMNVPLAGPIFAMEMTSRGAGASPSAARAWGAAAAASLAGTALVRGALAPGSNVGGHFHYGARAAGGVVGAVSGGQTVFAGLACGVGGAVVGTAFHRTLGIVRSAMWSRPAGASRGAPSRGKKEVATIIAKKALVAVAIAGISACYPQTMFWGEGSLQCAIDGQVTPFSATPHGIPRAMMPLARVDPNLPFPSGSAALQVGAAKFAAIALASAGGFPGGVIFPLLSCGATLSHAFASALRPWIAPPAASSSLVFPLMTMGFMAATLTSITRTPLATVLILALTASGSTPLSSLLPGVLMASYVSVWVSERLSSGSFFHYSK
jgi:H+/Cl- antiporter ClcA